MAVVFQSKAGECNLRNYSIEAVPLAIADALDNETEVCPTCKAVVKISIPRSAPKRIKMEATIGTGGEWD
jgi:hypothetical protein